MSSGMIKFYMDEVENFRGQQAYFDLIFPDSMALLMRSCFSSCVPYENNDVKKTAIIEDCKYQRLKVVSVKMSFRQIVSINCSPFPFDGCMFRRVKVSNR